MPTTSVEKLSPTRAKLTIAVPPEELKPSIKHAYEHIAEQVNVPGFRKGKVPPPIIDQRVGKAAVLEHAVNDGLDTFYQAAMAEHELQPLGRPKADIITWPNERDFSGDLEVAIEVDVRPEITVPDVSNIALTVDAAKVSADDIQDELDRLRSRFGTLVTVDRPAKLGDFATIDLVARIDSAEVDRAGGISYELGSGELLDGLDEALESLTAGESTTFNSELIGGDHAGEKAEVSVTVIAVKERELPEANDDFAQIASEFDTLAELKSSLSQQAERGKVFNQAAQAREELVEKLLGMIDVPVADSIVEDEVHRHLESEGRLEDDAHRAEVLESSTKSFKTQILLDALAKSENVQVSQEELSQHIVQSAAQYGMEPQEFVQALDKQGQLPAMVGEVARGKALATLLGKVKVTDKSGNPVDLSDFVISEADDTAAESDTGEVVADSAASSVASEESAAGDDEAEGAKKPAKRRMLKKKTD